MQSLLHLLKQLFFIYMRISSNNSMKFAYIQYLGFLFKVIFKDDILLLRYIPDCIMITLKILQNLLVYLLFFNSHFFKSFSSKFFINLLPNWAIEWSLLSLKLYQILLWKHTGSCFLGWAKLASMIQKQESGLANDCLKWMLIRSWSDNLKYDCIEQEK